MSRRERYLFVKILFVTLAILPYPTHGVSIPQYVVASYAQRHEDIFLYENYFYNKREGVILESGALDGIRFSTTYMFEKIFNWTTIHIEGDANNFRSLIRNRPNAINLNVTLCERSRMVQFLSHNGGAVSGVKEFMDSEFLKWRYDNQSHFQVQPVQCVSLRDTMKRLAVTHLDIWVLDLEGGELYALRGVDFNTLQIDVILMETTATTSRDALVHLLERNYSCVTTPNGSVRIRNYACMREGFERSAAPVLWNPRVMHVEGLRAAGRTQRLRSDKDTRKSPSVRLEPRRSVVSKRLSVQ